MRSYRSYDADADAACGCRLLLTVACCAGLGALYLFFAAAQQVRGMTVSAYDQSVLHWLDTRQAFEDAAFAFNVSWTTGHLSLRLSRTAATESPMPDQGADLLSYSPLRYETRWPVDELQWSEPSLWLTFHGSVASRGSSCVESLGGTHGLPLAYHEELLHLSSRQCVALVGGSYLESRQACMAYYALAELCVKVTLRDGCWRLSSAGGGYGCEPGPTGDWSVGVYRRVSGHHSSGSPSFHRDPPGSSARPWLRVRHTADPRVTAQNLTHGTLIFGIDDSVKTIGGLELLLCAPTSYPPTSYGVP